MRLQARGFRGHDPRWSFSPLSGDGAARTGGRFNRKGVPTLYLALDIITAVNECMQGLGQRLQPLLICEYDVDVEPVADLRTDASRAAQQISLDDLACGWLTHMRAGREPPSWRVVDSLRDQGFAGIVIPSFAPGAGPDDHNLVLWQWSRELPTRVTVHDPDGRLPKDQRSWR